MGMYIGMFEGYNPTIDEILAEIGVSSQEELKEKVLDRCRCLYKEASTNGALEKYGTPYDFIVCNSSQFYKVFVNIGYGNGALTIIDDLSPEKYFLMFADKIPEQLRPIAVIHETTEYGLVRLGIGQGEAHSIAEIAEICSAEKLNLKREYLNFLHSEFPQKFSHLKEERLI